MATLEQRVTWAIQTIGAKIKELVNNKHNKNATIIQSGAGGDTYQWLAYWNSVNYAYQVINQNELGVYDSLGRSYWRYNFAASTLILNSALQVYNNQRFFGGTVIDEKSPGLASLTLRPSLDPTKDWGFENENGNLRIVKRGINAGRFDINGPFYLDNVPVIASYDKGLSTPYDYIPDELVRAKIRSGASDAPSSDAALKAWLTNAIANAGENGASLRLPRGDWIVDAPIEITVTSPGRRRTFAIHSDRGAKLIPSPSNQYRFVVVGGWNCYDNSVNDSTGQYGDVWYCLAANSYVLGFQKIKTVNVGDQIWKGADGKWIKIPLVPSYHYQYWNAATNLDDEGNLVIFPGQGREGDVYVCCYPGQTNIGEGDTYYNVGDEAVYCFGAYRRRGVQGIFKGYWEPRTNTVWDASIGGTKTVSAPALTNSNGTKGDFYIVRGGRSYAPIVLDANHNTGLGDSVIFNTGQKVMSLGGGRWHRVWACATPRGSYDPNTGQTLERYHPATVPAGAPNGYVGPTLAYTNLDGAGYGDMYDVLPGINRYVPDIGYRDWKTGDRIMWGMQGWEYIPPDPGFNCGIFRFIHDDKTVMHFSGDLWFCSRVGQPISSGISNGWAVRSWSNQRAIWANYLFGSPMLHVERITVDSDHVDPSFQQANPGNWEGIWEVRNLYLPVFNDVQAKGITVSGSDRRVWMTWAPRVTVGVIKFESCYVPVVRAGNISGSFMASVKTGCEGYSVEMSDFEGGIFNFGGDKAMTHVFIDHGRRETPSHFQSTAEVALGDIAFCDSAVTVRGHAGVVIKLARPILPGINFFDFFTQRPACVKLESATCVQIDAGIPAAGGIFGPDTYACVLATSGNCADIVLQADISQADALVVVDARHNNNPESNQNNMGKSGGKREIEIRYLHGYSGDTATKKLVKGKSDLISGMITPFRTKALDEAYIEVVPETFPATGTINSYGERKLRYSRQGNTVHVQGSITINDAGNAALGIYVRMPFINGDMPAVWHGREMNLPGGKLLSCIIDPRSDVMLIFNYDNSYPAVSGSRLAFSGSFEIKS